MIQTIETHDCPKCESERIVRNGTDYKGDQKFYCHACKAYGTLCAPGRYTDEQKEMVLRAYHERVSMRGIGRIFGVSRPTLAQWLVDKGSTLPDLDQTLDDVQTDDVLELDELCSFVIKKRNKRWVWIALCRRTRQIVAYFIGDRSEKSCWQLFRRIPNLSKDYKKCRTYSDFWQAYRKVFPTDRHKSVGKASGKTAHVERWNLTLRQRVGRFVRATLSFSKSDFFHNLAVKLFIHDYNRTVA